MTGKFDLDLISQAPTTTSEPDGDLSKLNVELRELRHENSRLQDENDGLKKEISVESQKARLLVPFAKSVFRFCCVYTTISFCILFLHGYASIAFKLDVSTLNFVAGSNLASVIGLLAIIAGGLFSSK